MKLNLLGEWLSWFEEYSSECNPSIISSFEDYPDNNFDNCDASNNGGRADDAARRKFAPARELCERDNLIIDMLNSASSREGSTTVSFCVTDPSLPDNPVVYASDGFCHLTGYESEEVVGRNCRFLQGPETKRGDVEVIVGAIREERECSVRLLNYRKDGSTFMNEFYLAQLRSPSQKVVYFIGMQAAVDVIDEGGRDKTLCVTDVVPSNPGMKYSISSSQVSYSSNRQASWLA